MSWLVRRARRRYHERSAEREWREAGGPSPPPPSVKRRMLLAHAQNQQVRVFVETGTFHGDTLAALKKEFDQLHSIELDHALYNTAVERFAGDTKIKLWHGDSAAVLPEVLDLIDQPALFWLDGHYSGPGTARGIAETPILQELSHIQGHFLHGAHLVCIDDARLFDGTKGYPHLEALQRHAGRLGFGTVHIESDMIILRGRST